MTLLEKFDKINLLEKELETIVNTGKAETRKLSETEEKSFANIKNEIDNLKLEIENDEKRDKENLKKTTNIKMTTNDEKRSFNLIQAIRDKKMGFVSEETREFISQASKEHRSAGITPTSDFIVNMNEPILEKRDLTASGNPIIVKQKLSLVDNLYPLLISSKLGNFMTGLKNDISIPAISASTSAAWVLENGAATTSDMGFTEYTFKPMRITTQTYISNQLLEQDTIDAQQTIISNITKSIAYKLESTIWSANAATASTPAGIFYGRTLFNSGATSYAKIVSFEGALNDFGASFGKLGYVVSNSLKSTLKTTQKGTNLGFIIEPDGSMNGAPVFNTSLVPANSIVYGNWDNFYLFNWGNLEINVDGNSRSGYNQTVITCHSYWNFGIIQPNAFVFSSLT